MIDIGREELEEYLKRYTKGELTLEKLEKELKTDYRTLNKKIIEISITNPELYYEILETHPYHARKRTDIDFEALVIHIMKNRMTVGEAVMKFNISRRTIQRRADDLYKTNPRLAEIYRVYTYNNKRSKPNPPEIEEKIEALVEREVLLGEINDEREKFLEGIEKQFYSLTDSGMTQEEAAKKMGYHSNSVISKMLNELYRIKIEKNARKSKNEFKKSLSEKVSIKNVRQKDFIKRTEKVEELEGEVK